LIKAPTTDKIKISVIGLGYVGLPLAIEFSKKYPTIGFDNSKRRIEELKLGIDKTLETTSKELLNSKIIYTTELKDINDSNVYIITVPTPVNSEKIPDMSHLKSASELVGKTIKRNDVVIFESTVYPGATEEFCIPIIEKVSGLKYNIDFFCGYSPERINPGDKEHSLTKIIKITSGSNKKTADYVDKLYQSINPIGTYKVSSIAIAEAAKVIENIQRDVNIALINELSMIFNKLGLDTMEILEAAGTKWNFIHFQPGLVGGHCIGVDPYYLTYKSAKIGYNPEMILAGRRINDGMGEFIANCTLAEMTRLGINLINAKVGLLGLTFKENCPDIRNTKVPDIINNLSKNGCKIFVSDPFVNAKQVKELLNINIYKEDKIIDCDAIIVAVSHDQYKSMKKEIWLKKMKNTGVFIDVKSMFPKDFFAETNIVHWRL